MLWFNSLPCQEEILRSPCGNACAVSFYHRELPVQDGSSRRFLEGLDDKCLTQATEELRRAGALLDLMLTNKEDLTGREREGWEQPRHSGHEMEFRLLSGGEKAQSHNHSPGLQKSRLWPLQGSAWKNPMGHHPGEKRGPGVMAEFQGRITSSSSRMVHPNKQRPQEARMGA